MPTSNTTTDSYSVSRTETPYFFKIRKVSSGTTILFSGEDAKEVGNDFLHSVKNDVQFEHAGMVIYDDFSDWEYTDSNCMSFGEGEPWMKAKPDFSFKHKIYRSVGGKCDTNVCEAYRRGLCMC